MKDHWCTIVREVDPECYFFKTQEEAGRVTDETIEELVLKYNSTILA